MVHIAEWRNRHQVLAVINQKTPIGQVELRLNVLKNRYKHNIFAIRRDFYGELIFTEKAIIIFRMLKLGPIKLRSDTLVLAKNFDDKPRVDSLGNIYFLQQNGIVRPALAVGLAGGQALNLGEGIQPCH